MLYQSHLQGSRTQGHCDGIAIFPHEVNCDFRYIRIGKEIEIIRGHFTGKLFKVTGKRSNDEGDMLFVDPDSERSKPQANMTIKYIECPKCLGNAETKCSCIH